LSAAALLIGATLGSGGAAGQVTIGGSFTSTRDLDALCGGSCAGSGTVTIAPSAIINTTSGNATTGGTGDAVTGVANAWTVSNQGTIRSGAYGIALLQPGTVINAGTIASGNVDRKIFEAGNGLDGFAVYLPRGGMVENRSGAVLRADNVAILIGGAIVRAEHVAILTGTPGHTTVVNHAGATISGGGSGAILAPSPTTIINAGTITVQTVQIGSNIFRSQAIALGDGGSITNLPGGVIDGGTGVTSSKVTIVNQPGATISASGGSINTAAIMMDGGTITNAGIIRGNDRSYGIVLNGAVINSGLVEAANVAIRGGNGTAITNAGIIRSSGAAAIEIIDPTVSLAVIPASATVTNSGTIVGGAGTAIQFGNGTNFLILQTGSRIGGAVIGGTGGTNTLVIQGATVDTIAQFQNFGAVQVESGTLSGLGTVSGTLTNRGGTIAPGSVGNPGTLAVTGTFSQSAGGTLSSQVSPSAASRLSVGGAASINGTLAMAVVPGLFTTGTRYRVLTADGGVTGTFARVTSASPLLSFSPDYLPAAIDVTLGLNSLTGFTSNASLGRALDGLTNNPAFASLFTALYGLTSTGQVRDALNQIGGSTQNVSGGSSAVMGGTQVVTGALAQQVAAGRGASTVAQAPGASRVQLASLDPVAALAQGPAPTPFVTTSPWSAWLTGFGVMGGISGNASAASVSYATGGAALGADYRLDPAFLLGTFTSYSGTGSSVTGAPGSGSIDSYAVGSYASWTSGRTYVDGLLGYAYSDTSLKRTIAFPGFGPVTARARTDGHQVFSSLELGRSYGFIEGATLAPFVGVQASVLDQAPFTETGGGALNLAVRGDTVSSVRTQIGARVSKDFDMGEGKLINLSLKLGWAHELSDTGSSTTATFASAPGATFSVPGARRGRDTALVGVGASAKMHPNVNIYVRYDGDLNGADDAHAVMGGVRLTW
jgi:outer membrane autotransporter protein